MCCCGKPVVNGEMGYKWQPNDEPMIRPVSAPDLGENDTLIHDEPGRCGGSDSHCHHFRVVKQQYGGFFLLVRHGGGDERLPLGYDYQANRMLGLIADVDSNTRYWFLCALYHTIHDAERKAREGERADWEKAAAEGRIKTRKLRGQNRVRVTVEPKLLEVSHD